MENKDINVDALMPDPTASVTEYNEVVTLLGGKPLRYIGRIQLLSIVIMLISPISWIWIGWSIFWRVFLSCLVVVLVCYLANAAFTTAIKNSIDGYISNNRDAVLNAIIRKNIIKKYS